MSTSKLIIKHPDGEEVEIVVGREYRMQILGGKWKLTALDSLLDNPKLIFMKGTAKFELTNLAVLHNLPAKTARHMNQEQRLAVLRGGCEVKLPSGYWNGGYSYWINAAGDPVLGSVNLMSLTHYRCAPDWTIEREFVVEVDG